MTISTYLIQHCQTYIDAETISLTSTEKVRERALASARGYFAFATANPHEFAVLSTINPTTELPQSFDADDDRFPKGIAFATLQGLVRQSIIEGGGPESPWTLFEQTISLWATAHGLAMMCVNGPLSGLDNTTKFNFMAPVMDTALDGMIQRLGLIEPERA